MIDWSQEINSAQTLKHRQVKHFGYEFRYDNNRVDANKPLNTKIPSVCNLIFKRLRKQYGNILIPSAEPNQLTVNKYEPGQGMSLFKSIRNSLEIIMLLNFRNTSTCRHS